MNVPQTLKSKEIECPTSVKIDKGLSEWVRKNGTMMLTVVATIKYVIIRVFC